MRAIYNIRYKLRPKRQRHVGTVDISCLLSIDEKEIVALRFHGDICVLADFNIAVSPENKQSPIAPCAQAVWREPVEAHVAEALVTPQDHVPEILKSRMVRISHIC